MTENLPNNSDVERMLNNTQRYNLQETYQALANYGSFSQLSTKLKTLAKEMTEEKLKELSDINSKDELIRLSVEYLGKIDGRLKALAEYALKDHLIDKSGIQLMDSKSSLSSNGRCERSGDHINIVVNARKDATGIIAIAQNLIDASLHREFIKKENEENKKRAELARKSARKFIAYMMIDTIAKEPYMDINLDRKQMLINNLLRQDLQGLETIQTDMDIMQEVMNANPQLFEHPEDMDSHDFDHALSEYLDSPANPEIKEKIENRINQISKDEHTTTKYLIGDVLETCTALITIENCINLPSTDPIKHLMMGAINGYKLQEITGKTPEELANMNPEILKNLVHNQILTATKDEDEAVRTMGRVQNVANNNINKSN